jgi:hypothetical protein
MHAFEKTWDRVYARFRRHLPAPAAELAAEEVYHRLSTTLPQRGQGTIRVGDLLEAIVADMLKPRSDTSTPSALKKSA